MEITMNYGDAVVYGTPSGEKMVTITSHEELVDILTENYVDGRFTYSSTANGYAVVFFTQMIDAGNSVVFISMVTRLDTWNDYGFKNALIVEKGDIREY